MSACGYGSRLARSLSSGARDRWRCRSTAGQKQASSSLAIHPAGTLVAPFSAGMPETDGEHAMSTIAATAAPAAPKPLYTSLFVQVLAALLLGIVLGMAF